VRIISYFVIFERHCILYTVNCHVIRKYEYADEECQSTHVKCMCFRLCKECWKHSEYNDRSSLFPRIF